MLKPLKRADFLTPREAAEMMMCSSVHVRELIKKRYLPSYRVSNLVYVPKEAVEAFIIANTFPAIPQEERAMHDD